MKRLIYVFSVLVIAVLTLAGCQDENVKKLKKDIAMANAMCPINQGSAGDLLSIEYNEKARMVFMYYACNEEYGNALFLKKNREAMLNNIRLLLQAGASEEILKEMINAGAGLVMTFKLPSTGKTTRLELTYEDLKAIKDNPMSEHERRMMLIENKMAIQNNTCPQKIMEGMTITKYALVDDRAVVYVEVDEELLDFNFLKKNASQLKDDMTADFANSWQDHAMQKDMKLFTSEGIGMLYRYYGNKSKDCVDIDFTPDELFQFVEK